MNKENKQTNERKKPQTILIFISCRFSLIYFEVTSPCQKAIRKAGKRVVEVAYEIYYKYMRWRFFHAYGCSMELGKIILLLSYGHSKLLQ